MGGDSVDLSDRASLSDRIVYRERRSPFIRYFTKTPEGIHCPHFWMSAWANGCLHECQYCWARGTFRGYRASGGKPVVFTNVGQHLKEVERFLADETPKTLNFGELSDSLCLGVNEIIPVIEAFGRQKRHYAILVSKSAQNIRRVVKSHHQGQTIATWSLNPQPVIDRFELKTASLMERMAAAIHAQDAGMMIRFRIDPMLPVPNWEQLYYDLARQVSKLNPERVTLGSLRFFPSVPPHFKNREVFKWGTERDGTDGRYRLDFDLRRAMYQLVGNALHDHGVNTIGICKETEPMWKQVPRIFDRSGCNCLLPKESWEIGISGKPAPPW